MRKVFRLIKLGRLLLLAYRYRYRKVFIGQDDRFLFLDVFWTGGSLNALKKINIPRCNVSAVIYDLIPITHPQFVESANQRNFASNLPVLMEVAANYLCISETVASDLQRHTVSDQTRAERVLSFKLGSDFGPRVSTKKGVMQIGGVLKLQPWLVVGTIEPRKNHKYILDSFEALWAQGREESLLIVGRIGWMCEEIMMRLHSHSELGKRLFVFNDLDDAALDECYRQSKGLIFASYVEGFGLPLVEAFQRKIPVVCSDIPVFREVAGDAANYFDLSHRDGLLKLISAHKSEWHKGAKGIEWPSWDDSAKDFFDKLLGKRT
ncbi:MAG: glycosyltransferase family 4 protein [Bdellovibrionia bacterium]